MEESSCFGQAHANLQPSRACSKRGDIILDPFGGSGTTLLAAERTGRRARLVEIDPYYVDATIRRFEAMTGRKAVLSETGEPFAEVDVRRRAEGQASANGIAIEPAL